MTGLPSVGPASAYPTLRTPASICLIGPSDLCGLLPDASAMAATPTTTATITMILDMTCSSHCRDGGRDHGAAGAQAKSTHFVLTKLRTCRRLGPLRYPARSGRRR